MADVTAAAGKAKRVLITGASGLIGSALGDALGRDGHQVVPMTRSRSGGGEGAIVWRPDARQLNAADLEGADVIVHLAGENLAGLRWTEKKKRAIRDSRVEGTSLLAGAIAKLERKPSVFVCASAVGIYGSRGDAVLDESSGAGTGFLAEVCQEWERACEPAREAGVRVVNTRFGLVLSSKGGALKAMLTPFRLGLGGVVGSGAQWWSWVALEDAVRAIQFVMERSDLAGAVNVTAPEPVTNRAFTKMLGKVLARPTVLPLPEFVAKLVLGEMADEMLLSSTRVQPRRLVDAGFAFRYAQLEEALRAALGGGAKRSEGE